jgi:hypothetical protein
MYFCRLLWSAVLLHPVLTLSIPPQHLAQSPMLLEQGQTTTSTTKSVILAFTEKGSARVQQIEIPLQKRIISGTLHMRIILRSALTYRSGVDLPAHPGTITIKAVTNRQRHSVSLEELGQVMCRVVPRLSAEERDALDLAGMEKAWPWFRIRDETISFERASSRWFLAGRAVASYECR